MSDLERFVYDIIALKIPHYVFHPAILVTVPGRKAHHESYHVADSNVHSVIEHTALVRT